MGSLVLSNWEDPGNESPANQSGTLKSDSFKKKETPGRVLLCGGEGGKKREPGDTAGEAQS